MGSVQGRQQAHHCSVEGRVRRGYCVELSLCSLVSELEGRYSDHSGASGRKVDRQRKQHLQRLRLAMLYEQQAAQLAALLWLVED